MPELDTTQAVRMAMAKVGLNVSKMAEVMGVERQTVTNWRTKGCNDLAVLKRIATACGMELKELLDLGTV